MGRGKTLKKGKVDRKKEINRNTDDRIDRDQWDL